MKTGCRLLFVVTHSAAGGTQELWANLTEGLRGRGHDARLIALYPHEESASAGTTGASWRHVVERRPASPVALLRLLRCLVQLLRTEMQDYIFTAMPAANLLLPLAATFARTPAKVVISHHSPVHTYRPLLNLADGAVGLLPKVAAIVCVSASVAASLHAKPDAYRRRRRVIHNALPPPIAALLSRLASRSPRDAALNHRVVAIGRLAAEKNYPVLIRAAADLPGATIQILGSGPDAEILQALAAELRTGATIEFLGHRPRDAALQMLAAGDIFVQPSLYEGHSLAMLEAAELGLPLVVSDVPSQVEGITAADGQVCGIAVDPHDPVALASAIKRLLDESAHYRRSSELAHHLASSSSFDAMLDAYENLIYQKNSTAD
ncbi:glycosyltransferase family 4 protein [Falsiroseomonas sp. HC035]|uniref:glycosyltransferase family 4 protein n=1 Tax=Falsiroseomonas sp. HC035 TaxID=3390999 RepID=UPI003D31FC54